MPAITAVGLGIPDRSYTQEEIFRGLGHRRIYWDLFASAGIEKRHLCLAPAEMVKTGPQDKHEHGQRFALDLSLKALRDCLGQDGVEPQRVDCLVFVCCTIGFQSPAMGWEIAYEMGMREDVVHIPIAGAGCAGAGPGLRRAWEFLRLNPLATAAVVTAEISNAAYHPSSDTGVILGNALFADGASCYLVRNGPGLSMLDFVELHDYAHRHTIAMVWDQASFKLVLPLRASELTTPMVRRVLDTLLRRSGLSLGDIGHFVFHSGGRSILDGASQELEIPRERMEHSYRVWREHGNMSSATVGFAVRSLLDSGELRPGDRVAIVTMGAGFTGQGILCRYTGGHRD